MIIDNNLVMSNAQAVTTSAASTSYIDTLAAGDAISPGVRLKIQVNTAFVGGTSIAFVLQTDDNSGFSSATDMFTTAAIATASIDAIGDIPVDIVVPKGAERYIRVYYTVVGEYSSGNIDARIVLDTNKTMDQNL